MFQKLEEIRDYLYKYVETTVDLFKTETQEKIENMAVSMVYLMVLVCLVSGASIMALMVLAAFINQWLESRYAGFLIIFIFIILLLLLWTGLRPNVEQMIRKVLHKILNPKK